MANEIAVVQKECLRVIAEADKVTTIESLRVEALMDLMQERVDPLQAKSRSRPRVSGQATFIQNTVQVDCNGIAHTQNGHRGGHY